MASPLRIALDAAPNAQTLERLEQYTFEQLQKLFILADLLVSGHHEITYREPAKREEAVIVYADGTLWNPGSGKGFYYWNGSAWTFIA